MNFENLWLLPIWKEALFYLIVGEIFLGVRDRIASLICQILSLKLQNKIDCI